jgi:hypothetical protein
MSTLLNAVSFVVAEMEPPHGLTARILHPEGFGVLNDGPGRRSAP